MTEDGVTDSPPPACESAVSAVDLARRLDPDDTLGQAEQLAQVIDNPLVRLLLSLPLKRPRYLAQQTQEFRGAVAQMRGLLNDLSRAARLLNPLGWCVTATTSPPDEYARAADLVAGGDVKAAEALLVDTWNQPERLRTTTARIKTLYAADDERRVHRWRHLDQALRCHEAGLYAGSVCLVLSLLEGVVRDVTENARTPYRRGEAHLLTDEITLAGHPGGLPVLVRLLGAKQDETAATGELRRNGVLHGRELAYDTRENSTKALVALAAFVEWAQPLAAARMRAEQEERAARYAGSDGVDEDGKRLDRRGFPEVKQRLMRVLSYQYGRRRLGRPYVARLNDLDTDLATSSVLQLRLENDGDGFWAWERTTAGWVFGAAGRGGEQVGWLYSGPKPPTGPPGASPGWRNVATEPAHRDW